MNFPCKKRLRHWWWIVAFKYPRFRSLLTRLLIPARQIDIRLFGARLRIDTREEIGLWRAARMADNNIIFRDEVASLLNLALLLRPGDTFVDVGANVGLYSSVLSRLRNLSPDTSYVAIEPNPKTAERLRRSLGETVQVLNIALSDRAGELGFTSGVTSGVFRVSPNQFAEIKVRCERLEALLRSQTNLVMKIDVEGHELPVLRGAAALFNEQRIKVIYIDGYSDEMIPDFLRERGFALYHGRALTPCGAEAPRDSLLAIHRSRLQMRAAPNQ
ncbi:MAG TPA: FkbM family methyltransferase [Chthoniobacterales bacterium]|jgi:FkbM family methyltransferase|nr:FkbM family methyltransferase [Chthoniobacterales bacterium]